MPRWHEFIEDDELLHYLKAGFDENEARDNLGRWTSGGDLALSGVDIEHALPPGETAGNPITTTDVHVAALALRDGKFVELDQPNGPSTLLDEIDRMVKDAVARGEDKNTEAAKYDLCRASIPGTNLNCEQAVVESRSGMPQLKTKPEELVPDSPAAKMVASGELKVDDRGEVDLTPLYLKHLKDDLGIKSERVQIPAENLRASQRELNGGKVASMANALESGSMTLEGTIVTTRDDYVLDGHHRWAATVGYEYSHPAPDAATPGVPHSGPPVSISITSDRLDMSITAAIADANEWTHMMGIPHASLAGGFGKIPPKSDGVLSVNEIRARFDMPPIEASVAHTKSDGTLSPKESARSDSVHPNRGFAMSTKRAEYEVSFKSLTNGDGTPSGEFEADVSVFGNVDKQGDRILPGAFRDYIERAQAKGDPIPVVWSHKWDDPAAHIGYVDPRQMRETDNTLRVRGHIDLDNPFAKQVHRLMSERRVTGWSFAYDVHNERRAKDGANELLDLSIVEVGPTLKGANPEAQLISAKALDMARDEYENMKAGRRLSTATQDSLQAVYDKLESLCQDVKSLMSSGTYDATPDGASSDEPDGEKNEDPAATPCSHCGGAKGKVEEGVSSDAVPSVGGEPAAKATHEPDTETLLLRNRIEEMRLTRS